MGLTDIIEELGAADGVLAEKQAEFEKEAQEEEYAGRIAARGFYDELQKIAGVERVNFKPAEVGKITGKPAAPAPGGAPPAAAAPKPPAPGGAMGAVAKATGPGTPFANLTAKK
jgi:hypothetical protein